MNHTKSTPVRLEKQTSFKETFMKGTVTVRFSYPFLFIVGFHRRIHFHDNLMFHITTKDIRMVLKRRDRYDFKT